MSTETRERVTATPLYPGMFLPEDGRPVVIPDAKADTAVQAMGGDDLWFCIEVRTVRQKRWSDGAGNELWKTMEEVGTYRIYAAEEFTAEQVEQLDGDHSILLANMRGNEWATVVRTRRGNWQPVMPGDVVIAPQPAGSSS